MAALQPHRHPHTHGSGCTLSAAITAHLARGWELRPPIWAAKTFVEGGLRHSLAIGNGPGPLCQWHPLLPRGLGDPSRDCSGSGSTTRR